MLIRRLQWAGVYIETKNTKIAIDPVYQGMAASFFGKPKQPFSRMEDLEMPDVILITHLHSDHFDPVFLRDRFGTDIRVLVPRDVENIVKGLGFRNTTGVGVNETMEIGDASITASYSVDGLGDPQVSWVVGDGEKTVIHSGDTLWHGWWWNMAEKFGPIHAALLPVNGAIVNEEGVVPSGQPICLNPEQAAAAAKVLGAGILIPIHFGSFHNPPVYNETPELVPRLMQAARLAGVTVRLLGEHEDIQL